MKGKKLIVPDSVMAREVGDELVILNLDNEQYYALDEIGARMWELMTTSPTLQDAIDALLEEYDVDVNRLYSDLQALIDDLVAEDLLTIHDA